MCDSLCTNRGWVHDLQYRGGGILPLPLMDLFRSEFDSKECLNLCGCMSRRLLDYANFSPLLAARQ